jgi:hypothetical protein
MLNPYETSIYIRVFDFCELLVQQGGNKHTISNGAKAENISLLNANCFKSGNPPNALAPFDF